MEDRGRSGKGTSESLFRSFLKDVYTVRVSVKFLVYRFSYLFTNLVVAPFTANRFRKVFLTISSVFFYQPEKTSLPEI